MSEYKDWEKDKLIERLLFVEANARLNADIMECIRIRYIKAINDVESLKEKCASFNRMCKDLAQEVVIAHSPKNKI
jgi:hypothetical protein